MTRLFAIFHTRSGQHRVMFNVDHIVNVFDGRDGAVLTTTEHSQADDQENQHVLAEDFNTVLSTLTKLSDLDDLIVIEKTKGEA